MVNNHVTSDSILQKAVKDDLIKPKYIAISESNLHQE